MSRAQSRSKRAEGVSDRPGRFPSSLPNGPCGQVLEGAMAKHDSGYKLLFSHPEMVEDLLRGFLREAWAESLDFTTLERVRDGYIGANLHERRGDMVWRLRWKDE